MSLHSNQFEVSTSFRISVNHRHRKHRWAAYITAASISKPFTR